MEDNLDAIARSVEQLYAADLVENGVGRIVGHVVRYDGRERVALESKYAALQKDFVFFLQKSARVYPVGRLFTVPAIK
jgi:hypothetical protein